MRRIRSWGPGLLLVLPSLLALGVFVYGFIGWNVRVSFSSWQGLVPRYDNVGVRNYADLRDNERFHLDLGLLWKFTLVFVGGAPIVGFVMAVLLEKGLRGESFFRSVFLFPMAISFIATGIIWRWLLDNGSGRSTAGLNKLFANLGVG